MMQPGSLLASPQRCSVSPPRGDKSRGPALQEGRERGVSAREGAEEPPQGASSGRAMAGALWPASKPNASALLPAPSRKRLHWGRQPGCCSQAGGAAANGNNK